MTPRAEPLPLPFRLKRDVLVLQPINAHLDVEPLVLKPGLRCSIGSAEHCAVRLPTSTIVQPEHCVIEAVGRQTMLTAWADEATWLNDRVVTELRELVPGDRVAIGPFDFHLRSASPDELLSAKLVEQVPRETLGASKDPTPERLTQNISKLLGNLPSQADQGQCEHLRQNAAQLLRELEAAVREIELNRAALRRDQAVCSKLTQGLIQKELCLADWEGRLCGAILTPNREREVAPCHPDEQAEPSACGELGDPTNGVLADSAEIAAQPFLTTLKRASTAPGFVRSFAAPENDANQSRPLQTLLAVTAFGLSAYFFGTESVDPDVSTRLGLGAAVLGGISTVDLYCRRWLSSGR